MMPKRLVKKPVFKSFAVHLVLLGTLFGVLVSRDKPERDAVIEVQVADFHVHRADSFHSTHAIPKTKTKAVKAVSSAIQTKTDAVEKKEQAEDPGSDHPAWESLSPGQRNDYLASIIRLISAHQNYPRSSVLNEEEGVVQLKVALDSEGGIATCEIAQTSGFTRLDEAAIHALREVGRLPLPAPHISGVVLFIPIRFELQN